MKLPIWFAAMGLAALSGAVGAQTPPACSCVASAVRLSHTQIAAALGGKTVCAVFGSNERWQEFHGGTTTAGGVLEELGNKAGGEAVGSWRVDGTDASAQIVYSYSGGSSYSYSVCQEASSYHFCGARNITNASVVDAKGTCGAGFTRP